LLFSEELKKVQEKIKAKDEELKKMKIPKEGEEDPEREALLEELNELDYLEAVFERFLEEYPGCEVKIRELTFGEVNSIMDTAANITFIGGKQRANPKMGQAKLLTLAAGIVSAPFKKGKSNELSNLPSQLGSYLYNEIDGLGAISPKKKRR
jgi:hypothetical protein